MTTTLQTRITVDSGNAYFCRATMAGIDACSEQFVAFGAADNDRRDCDRFVVINRVSYFARGLFTINCEAGRQWNWDPLGLSIYRNGNYSDPTSAARCKIEREICEAVGYFAKRYPRAMAEGAADDFEAQAQREHGEAKKLQAAAADHMAACGALLDRAADVRRGVQ